VSESYAWLRWRRAPSESTTGICKTQRGPPPRISHHDAQQVVKLVQRDTIVLGHLPLAKAIAIRVHANLPVHVDLDDLVHAGVLGLIDAASKFDSSKQGAFSSYAKHRIRGAILDSVRDLDWATRDMRRKQKQVEAATRALTAILQRTPTEEEVAEKFGVDVDRWRKMMLDVRHLGPESASTRADENQDLPAPDFPSAPDTHPDWMWRSGTTTQRAWGSHDDTAGASPACCPALLRQGDDNERDRRRTRHQ
jgi:RNA polymerase sigma factor FliA